MAVGTAVAGETGIHQPQTVQKFRPGAEGASDPRYARPLVQGQSCGYIEHLVYLGLGGLGHPTPCVGGQRLQISSRSLRVEHSQRQGGFAGTGNPGDPHNLI